MVSKLNALTAIAYGGRLRHRGTLNQAFSLVLRQGYGYSHKQTFSGRISSNLNFPFKP
ncbi:MAG: hypothetical protein V7K94_30820 [Nostoc sp.]